jgi:hypothetical protein
MPRNNTLVAVLVAIVVAQSVVMTNLLWSLPAKETLVPQAVAKPSKLDPIPDSTLKRITLTPKAVERVGIAVGSVSERKIERTMVTAGEVSASAGGEAVKQTVALNPNTKGSSSPSSLVVQVPFSGDNARLDVTKPARVVRLGKQEAALIAAPLAAGEPSGSGKSLLYKIEPAAEGFAPGERVRVEIPYAGSGTMRKTVPHSAVIYDSTGIAWVYTTPDPPKHVYVRQRVDIDFIEGDVAVLKSGPANGTAVVSVGATLLWGTELGK